MTARSLPPRQGKPDSESMTPLVLLVDDQEWTSRSLESVLRPKGHVVVKAYTGRQALELVPKINPDAIIVDFHLPDMDGVDLARKLKQADNVHAATPLFMMSTGTIGRAQRLEALGAGAWDILRHPVDPAELVLRLDTFVRAKAEADFFREEGLTDHSTGTYNTRGLVRRTAELSAEAVRSNRPVAVVTIGPEWSPTDARDEGEESRDRRLAEILQSALRGSDTLGRFGPGEFAIVAPATDREGATRLAERILDMVRSQGERSRIEGAVVEDEIRVRAGLYATPGKLAVDAADLLAKATTALRRAQVDPEGVPVRFYDA